MATLELKQVRKNYGNLEVIHGIDLFINNGEFCVLVGPSGCGKSTLLRMIAGLEQITKGDILIDEQVVNNISAARRGLAMFKQLGVPLLGVVEICLYLFHRICLIKNMKFLVKEVEKS